jgi:formylglycine-generating enzyme
MAVTVLSFGRNADNVADLLYSMCSELVSRYCRSFGVVTLAILAASFVGSAQAVTISTVPVGFAGNAPDPATGSLYGAVPYNYNIGTYDVTNAQYVAFLNSKAAAADPYGLWNSYMDPGGFEGAISRSGSGPYSYSVKPGFANKPVIFVTWYDSVRFVNWLTNGQGNGDTESGTYLIANGGDNSGTVLVPDAAQRTLWATTNSFHWLLPSENEWYKAAYYNAPGGTYYAYPFQSNSRPGPLAPPGNTNSLNSSQAAYNYDGNRSYLTDVGAYPNSLSLFGSFDMGGDVFQWNDTSIGSSRGTRGGGWGNDPGYSAATFRFSDESPSFVGNGSGFRVASVGSVPEPSAGLLAALACGMIWLWRFKSFARHRIARRGVLRNDVGI